MASAPNISRTMNNWFEGSAKSGICRIHSRCSQIFSGKENGACPFYEEESGIPFQSSTVTVFIQQILDGNWDGSLASLRKIGILDESVIKSASFMILQQKFLELLDREKMTEALKTLRTEISPLSVNSDRVRELSFYLLSSTMPHTNGAVNGSSGLRVVKPKPRSELLEELQKLFPPTVLIPDKRLLQLVEQALDLQREACLFHNSSLGETSLFTDHQCGRDQIPSQTVQMVNVKFSRLTDKSIVMWDLDGKEIECLKGQKTIKISDLHITSDGKLIITVCKENTILLIDRESKNERCIEEEQMIVSFTLSRDNKYLLVSLVNEELHLWSIQGHIRLAAKYKGHRRSRFIVRACFGGLEQAFIASGSEDSQVYIWHRGSGELIQTLRGHSSADEDEPLGYEASDKEVDSDLESIARSKPKRKKLKKTAKAIPDYTFRDCPYCSKC
ncbi:CTLH, C-terminal LisH motif-containing protein [Tanacetum coccineum]